MSSVILSYEAKVTLIDKTAALLTPITINGDTTGSMGTGSDFFVDLKLTSSGIKKVRNGVLKLRSVDGIFITNGPILIDSETKSKYWIDAQIIQKDSNDDDIDGELFRMQIGTPIIENTDKGLFLTLPLTAIEYRLKESLESEQLILQTPKDAFISRVTNYFNTQGSDAPLIVIDNEADIELPDDDVLKQNWLSQGPITTHRALVEIIERLANPGVVGGSFTDFYYYFEPSTTATKTVFIKAEEFGARSSGVILDVLGPSGATDEEKQTFQTDNLKFKNVVIARGANSAHRMPMEHTRFASDVEHAKVSNTWDSGTTYDEGNYVQYDIGSGDIQLFKSLVDSNLNNQPDVSPTEWNNLSTSIEFSPWTNDADVWKTNFAGYEINKITAPAGNAIIEPVITNGEVTGAIIVDGDGGYIISDSIVITGTGSSATGEISSLGAGGVITGIDITASSDDWSVGFALDMNLARADYDRTDVYNEFETITFKWVTKVGVNDPDDEPTDEIFDGQRYIVGDTPTGDFAGQENKLAQYDTSGDTPVWQFSNDPIFIAGSPDTQDSVLDLETAQIYKWDSSDWVVAWTLDSDSGISSPLHQIKSIANVTGPTNVDSAIELEFNWDNTSDVRNEASRGAWWHMFFPFPRQANAGASIDVGDLYKQPILDFINLDITPEGLTGWNNGLDSEDLGNLRGVNVKMRLSITDSSDDLIDFMYDLPIIWWFMDKFDRIVYTETKIRRNGEWDTLAFPAGPDAKMELYDNRIDELVTLLGYTLPFNFFLQEKEYTGVRFDWRQVKAQGCFYKDPYDQNFFYKNAESDLFDNFIQHITQVGLNLLSGFEESVANVVIDKAKLALDELTFIKDSYVSSRDDEQDDSRQKLVNVTSQSDYLNLKNIAEGVEVRDAFFPQFQTLDAYGDVRLRLGLTFVAQGTRVPNSPLTMVVGEVTHSITQNSGYRVQVIAVNKFEVSS